jgi:hypothetical protein
VGQALHVVVVPAVWVRVWLLPVVIFHTAYTCKVPGREQVGFLAMRRPMHRAAVASIMRGEVLNTIEEI